MRDLLKQMDAKELEFPNTVFVRDIDDKVFQSIVVQCLLTIQGIALVEGNLLDYFLGREPAERISGISVQQDPKTHSVEVKIEVKIAYGVVIAEKAKEIQEKVARELSHLTDLHVSMVHVVFKNLITTPPPAEAPQESPKYSDF